jgi:hypothetical protein
MINITNANSVVPFNRFRCFHKGCSKATSGRLGHFPDVKISKRPNVLPSIFIGGLGRSGRSGRLSGVSCWEGKRTCFSPYVDRIGKHVLNVRTSGNASNHISQSSQNRKATSV